MTPIVEAQRTRNFTDAQLLDSLDNALVAVNQGVLDRRPPVDNDTTMASGVINRTVAAANIDSTPSQRASLRNRVGTILDYKLPPIFGNASVKETLTETLAVGALAAGLKWGSKVGISQLGLFSSLGTTVAIGAAGGAIQAGVREGYKQFVKERKGGRSAEWAAARGNHKNILVASWHYADKKRLARAIARGAITGTIGSIIGFGVVDLGILSGVEHIISDRVGEAGRTVGGAGQFASDRIKEANLHAPDQIQKVREFVSSSQIETGVKRFVSDRADEGGRTIASAKSVVGLNSEMPPSPAKTFTQADLDKAVAAARAPLLKKLDESELSVSALSTENKDLFNKLRDTFNPSSAAQFTPGDLPAGAENLPPIASAAQFTPGDLPAGAENLPPIASAAQFTPGDLPAGAENLPPSPIDTIAKHVANLKDISLPAGSNPWQVATTLLTEANPDHTPSNDEILKVTRILCERNNIGVPDWGIGGEVDHRNIPVGYVLKLDDEVKSVIGDILKGGNK